MESATPNMCGMVKANQTGFEQVMFELRSKAGAEKESSLKEEVYPGFGGEAKRNGPYDGDIKHFDLQEIDLFNKPYEDVALEIGLSSDETQAADEKSSEDEFGRPKSLRMKRAQRGRVPMGELEVPVGIFITESERVSRRVLLRQRSYARGFVAPPKISCPADSGRYAFIRSDISFGAKFVPENMDITNKAVIGSLSHMSVGEMFPFIYMVHRGKRAIASRYWDALAASFPRFRITGVFRALYRFVLSHRELRLLVEDPYTFPESLAAIAYSEQYILTHGEEENCSRVAATFVAAEQGPPRVGPLRVAEEWRPRLLSWEEFKPDFDHWAYKELHANCYKDKCLHVPSEGVDEIHGHNTGIFRSKGPYSGNKNWSQVRLDTAKMLAEDADFEMGRALSYARDICRQLIQLETIVHFFLEKDYARMIGQIFVMSGNNKWLLGNARAMYNAWADYKGAKKVMADNAMFDELNNLEEESDKDVEEVEEKAENPNDVEYVLGIEEGPAFLAKLGRSTLWRKLLALVSAATVPEILMKVPGFMKTAIVGFADATFTITSHSNLAATIASFCTTFVERLTNAWEKKSFWAFLKEGGFETIIPRGNELLTASLKGPNAYVSISEILAEMDAYIEEATALRISDGSRTKQHHQLTPEHHRIFSAVVLRRSDWEKKMNAMAPRKREPSSVCLYGPPGVGKTTRVQEMTAFVVNQEVNRPLRPDGKKDRASSDLYSAPSRDKHWNNCSNPLVLLFNDIPGDGYTANGTGPNIPELLRLAVDTEPFWTPQADIDSKADNVIDPRMVVVTSNSMKFMFACFGTDWSKLLRRYSMSFYIAFPPEFYLEDIEEHGDGHGILRNKELKFRPEMEQHMRVYVCKAVHESGVISVKRTQRLAGGIREMMLIIKKDYIESRSRTPYDLDSTPSCCCYTPLSSHDNAKCMEGCDFPIVEPPAPRLPGVANPMCLYADADQEAVVVVQGGVSSCCKKNINNLADAQARRIMQEYREKALAIFNRVRDFVVAYGKEFALAAASVLTAVIIGKGIADRVKKKKDEVVSVEGNVINPIKHLTEEQYIVRYGIEEASAREMPNAPKFPTNIRAHAFMSPVSKTTSRDDLRKLVESNTRSFLDKEGTRAVGVFLDSTTLFMNHHVWKSLEAGMVRSDGVGNEHKFFGDLSQAVHDKDNDITLVRTQPFPAAALWSHMPIEVGKSCSISVGGSDWMQCDIQNIDFGGKIDLHVKRAAVYDKTFEFGDCGTPGVADVNGKGILMSYHIAKLASGKGAGLLFGPHFKALSAKLPGKGKAVVALPFVESVEELHSRSKLRAARHVSMEVLGTFEKGKNQSKSRLVPTEYYDLAMQEMKDKKTIPSLQVDGVMVDGVWMAPYVHKFKGMEFEPTNIIRSELRRAALDFCKDSPVVPLKPLTLAQAIGGVEGDPMLKKMNFKTSAGLYQRFYPDKSFLIDDTEISSDVLRLFWRYVEILEKNIVAEHQKWCLKDELVTFKKEAVKKYRYFMVSEVLNLLAMRMFVAPLVAHMYRNKEFYEAYGAFNPASGQFGEAFLRLKIMGFLIMADISHMDSSHRSMLAETVADIFCCEAKKAGYNETSLNVLRNLIESVVFTIMELNGDLAFISEGMGSGVYITFIFNCIVLSIMYRVAWFRKFDTSFRESNKLMCGGDDSALGTKERAFTGKHVKTVFGEYGYELSPPTDKTGAMVDHFGWDEFVFLKRTPNMVMVGSTPITVGALDCDSIYRSIGWRMSDVAVTPEDRMAQVLDAGQREMSLHGKEAFERFHRQVGKKVRFRRLTYDETIEKYVKGDLYDDLFDPRFESSLVESVQGHAIENKNPQPHREHYVLRGVEQLREAGEVGAGGTVQAKAVFTATPRFAQVPEPNWKAKPGNYKAQTHSANFIGNDKQTEVQEQTTVFEMASAISSVEAPTPHDARYALPNNELSIQEALRRPVYLATYTWTPISAAVTTVGSVYDLWRTDLMVSSKLYGYKFWRGKPVLRLVVNGFSFYYGKLVFSVDLNPGEDGVSAYNGLDPKINTVTMVNACQAMQAPHVSVDPSESCTYDFPFPWYSATGWYNRFDATVTPVATLKAFVINALASASSTAPTSVTVQVYMFLEDIELSIPAVEAILGGKKGKKTMGGVSTAIDLVPKAAPEEAKPSGTLSKALSAASGAAGLLTSIPQLAPFAGPFSIGAGMAAKVATALGYSAPRVIEENYMIQNQQISPMQYTDGRHGVGVLAGDPKQGVAVSAEAAGIGEEDDMMISSIVTRFGLLQTLSWTTSGLSEAISVRPYALSTYTTGSNYQMLPISFVTNAFRFWTGSLVYRIEIVASAFHRGAIGVSWIPYDDPPGGSVLTYPNRYLTKVIDITQSKTVDFTVPFAGERLFLPVGTADTNGVLRFYQINPLTSSGSTSAVSINIYLAAGPDFDLHRPTTDSISNLTPIPVAAVQGSKEETVRVINGEMLISKPQESLKMISFGEGFRSIKQLCNRHCTMVYRTTLAAITVNNHPFVSLPLTGTVRGKTDASNMINDYSMYFAVAFLAMRGGRRWKLECSNTNTTPVGFVFNVFVGNRPLTTALAYPNPYVMGTTAMGSATSRSIWAATGNGQMTCYAATPGLMVEFETPYMGECQFYNPRKPYGWDWANATSANVRLQAAVVTWDPWTSGTQNGQLMKVYGCAADDFSLHGFFFVPEFRVPV